MTEPDVDLIDALAAIIREVDGNHSLGAAALAEAILDHYSIVEVQIAGSMRPQENTMTEQYHTDYPKEPIGGGNPYKRCAYCKISDPQINGEIENHADWCEYRKQKEAAMRPQEDK